METFSPSNSSAMSDDIRELSKALLIAKTKFRATGLGSENNHMKYKYAKLGDFYNAVEDALFENNIIISHYRSVLESGERIITTRLIHTLSGQWIQDMALLVSEKPGNQGQGAAQTYMIKDALRALCAIAAKEDDDGADEDKYIQEEANKFLTGKQVLELIMLFKTAKNAGKLMLEVCNKSECNDIADILKIDFDKVKKYIIDNKE